MGIIGTIFWTGVAIKTGQAAGNFLGEQANIITEKQYDKEAKKIKSKYYTTFEMPSSFTAGKGPKVFEKYNNDLNELKKRYGKKEHIYVFTEKKQEDWERHEAWRNGYKVE